MRRRGSGADSALRATDAPSRRGAGAGMGMTPTRLLIGQIALVFAIVALGVWGATEWAAAMLAYQPELGASM